MFSTFVTMFYKYCHIKFPISNSNICSNGSHNCHVGIFNNLMPYHFTSMESLWYPVDRRLGELQSWSGCSGKEKYSCPCREHNPGYPTCSL